MKTRWFLPDDKMYSAAHYFATYGGNWPGKICTCGCHKDNEVLECDCCNFPNEKYINHNDVIDTDRYAEMRVIYNAEEREQTE